jgi:septum formation protein
MILKEAGVVFRQRGVDFDESRVKALSPQAMVYAIAKGKLHHYMSLFGDKENILCADTVVVCQDKILGKAKDYNEARQMLRLQSGNRVDILTAMIYHTPSLHLEELAQTTYQFLPFDLDDLDRYLDSMQWKDKAGACMVEGFCKPYIQSVSGFESTAKGLCIETLYPFLEE